MKANIRNPFAYYRTRAGLTQIEAAQKLGMTSYQAISLWETGKTMPRIGMLPKIAELYGCAVDDLLKKEVTT